MASQDYRAVADVAPGTYFKDVPAFQMQAVRNGFVRKVYGIVAVQLAITFVIAGAISQAVPPATLAKFLTPATVISVGGLLALQCFIMMSPESMKHSPTNYIVLLVFTVLQSVLVGIICCVYEAESVALAFGVTMGIFMGLTICAFTTKIDFTGMGGYLLAGLIGLFFSSLFFCFIPMKTAMVMRAGLGATLFSFYIVYDTQLIMGGQHKKHQFSIDEYVWAALNIYLDIINLFIKVLQLMGEKKDKKNKK